MFLCEPLESGILNVVVNGATSSYDIRGLTMADIKQVTGKDVFFSISDCFGVFRVL